ncbi:hypothetical protein [Seonamhaeicola marinus]|uniref:Cytochrome c domain-containing protein n=1 Tax=Seonamhaeicola marinus TaxID=1912246 RepID=A0A5D0HJP2_9FLAO|nr:hypothetical protein [Seonamhaeicola marinus]TYA71508.1 hypothetical protein FUA24_18185 [Seonamhaeicola marinus]
MKHILVLLMFTLIFSCKKEMSKTYESNRIVEGKKATEHPGKKLMEGYCYACHDASTSHEKRIAPPMIAIKKHYILDGTSKEMFISAIQEWIKNPTEDKAKMYGAVRRFGVMQKLSYPDTVITQIAEYIYDYDIEEPDWFQDHFKERQGNMPKH